MKLGVVTTLFQDYTFEAMLDKVASIGLQAIELGTGGWPGNAHCKLEILLKDKSTLKSYQKAIQDRGLMVSALSCHGNPLHPDSDVAAMNDQTFRQTVLLAEQMEVPVINLFSGCPGDSESAKYPNWVVATWPPEFSELYKWQWEEKVIPYWRVAGEFAAKHGVKLAFEMHPGFVVYNPETLLRLREAVGPVIGANYDPSHLYWQGIDPIASIRALGESIFHVHAKDTLIDEINTAINGVLDMKPYSDVLNRSWSFRTVGYGHDQLDWRSMIGALRLVGYDYVLSIEHEDPLASIDEGFTRAVSFLNDVIFTEKPPEMWWA